MDTRQSTKEMLASSAVELIVAGGIPAATVRAIATRVGITDGAVYRHFHSKEEIYRYAYRCIVEDMLEEKRKLLVDTSPLRDKLKMWINLSYRNFDAAEDAFAYVLLLPMPKQFTGKGIAKAQGKLFMKLMKDALDKDEIRNISPELALSHFSGLLLNVPRLIIENRLPRPALQYTNEIADCVWKILKPSKVD